jgi:hypothetical protein
MSSGILTQCLIYPRGSIGDQKHLKRWALYLSAVFLGLTALTFAIELNIDQDFTKDALLPYGLQTQTLAGYGFFIVHFSKYCPQFYRNTQRHSTVGLSPKAVLFELLGSLSALVQLISDFVDHLDRLNMLKLGMCVSSSCFSLLFQIQHYLIYREAAAQDRRKWEFETSKERREHIAELIDLKLQKIPVFEEGEAGYGLGGDLAGRITETVRPSATEKRQDFGRTGLPAGGGVQGYEGIEMLDQSS